MSNEGQATVKALNLELVQGILSEQSNGRVEVDNKLDTAEDLAQRPTGQEVYAVIRDCISTKHITSLTEIKNFKREIIHRHVCDDHPLFPFLQIAAVLHDACLKAGTRPSQTDWEEAILTVLANIPSLSVYQMTTESLMISESRSIAVANAAKRLKAAGYEIEIVNGQVQLTAAGDLHLRDRIVSLCQELGGLPIVDTILRFIQAKYDERFGRYQLGREVRTTPGPPIPQVPWPYLLQLGVKFHRTMPAGTASDEMFQDLVRLTTDAMSLYDVQPYSAFETMLNSEYTIGQFLRRSAFYDSAFVLNQIRTSDAQKLYRRIFCADRLSSLAVNGITLETVVRVCDAIFEVVRPTTISTLNAELVSQTSGIPVNEVTCVLDDVLTHKASAPNENLSFPPLSTEIDFGFRPLLQLPDGTYCLLPTAITGAAFYEALASFARQAKKTVDDDIGETAEDFIKSQLSTRGVTYKSGVYKLPKMAVCKIESGECDIVVETQDTILLLELKKKALTRLARSGSDIKLFIDLSLSLIDAQLQTMRHEAALREFGQLKLVSRDGNETVLDWNNRAIERIALTVLDFGSVQDRGTLLEFLSICCRVNFHSSDPAYAKEFGELREKQEELRRLGQIIGEFDQNIKKRPFFSCWFLSVPQLLLILDKVSCNEDLRKELWQTRNVTFGSQDFYREYAYVLQITDSRQ